jgi:ligand-binding sensor domain-containing protein
MTRFPQPRPHGPAIVPALVALALGVAGLCALAPVARGQTGVWRQISLSGAGANAVAGGDSGSVLAVSTAGLFRYDGLRIQRVPIFSTRADSLDGSAVLQAANGDIWFGTTDQGLFRLRPDGVVDRYTAQSGLGNSANDEILVLAETPDGAIWAGTNQGGLSRFDGTTWTTLTTDQGMPSMTVKALAVDPRDGSIWAGTLGATAISGGLVHVVNGAVAAVYDQFTLTPNKNVFCVTVTRAGEVWVGHDVGIARLVGGAFEEISAGVSMTALAEGAHGELWFGTSTRGIGSVDVGSLAIISGGPPSNTVSALHRDPAGVLWVATTGGLSRFEGAAWRSYSRFDLLPQVTNVLAAARDFSAAARGDSIDGHGIVWIGGTQTSVSPTQNLTLVRRANGRLRAIGTEDGLPSGALRALAVSDSGAIWCAFGAGVNGGLARVRADGTVAQALSGTGGFPVAPVFSLADAGAGAVWATTRVGAYFVDRSGVRALPIGPGQMPNAPLTGVALDGSGRVWFSTGTNPIQFDGRTPVGAIRFDPVDSSYMTLGTAQGMPTDSLFGVTVAPNGDVWFASAEGAIRYREGVLRTFRAPDGLNSNFVRGLDVAPDGTVWAATGVGIARFDGTLWSTYNVADGLAGSVARSVFADSLGAIVSCEAEGASLFHPDRTPPRVEITSGPPAATGSSTVQFAVRGGDLDSDASRVRISSELVGRGPTPFAEDVTAITLNLPDGEYEFLVRAKDRALNETGEPFAWRFAVDATPPRPVVQQPAFNAVVSEIVPVLGTVADPRFEHYVFELRPQGAVAWDTLFTSPSPPPPGAPIFDWDSRTVDDGPWELRVGVADSLGLIGYAQVSVIVDNFAPGASVTAPAQVDHVQGGSVFTTHGEVELYVPPNAFAADQIVRIEPLPAAFPLGVGPTASVLDGWVIRANDPDLAKPATLSLKVTGDATGSTIARLVVTGPDTTLVAVGGAPSADGTRLATSITQLGTYVIATGVGTAAAFDGPRALDCQPRVLSPRGGGFDVRTAISFELGRAGAGAVKVYDRAGRLVKEIVENDTFNPGSNVVYWDGTDGDGEVVPSGLYTVAVRFDGKVAVRTVAVANR